MATSLDELPKLELTEREVAIAGGNEPDEATSAATESQEATPDAPDAPELPEDPEAADFEADPEDSPRREPRDPEERESAEEAAERLRAQVEDDGDDQEDESDDDTPDWITTDVLDIAATYGMGESEVKDFKSLAEFQRAGRLIDARFASADSSVTKESETKEEPASQEPKTPVGEVEVPEDEAEFLKRFEEYPEEVHDLVRTSFRAQNQVKQLEGQIKQIVDWQQNLVRDQYIRDFDKTVDGINEDLFGVTEKDGEFKRLTDAHSDQRTKLFEAAQTIMAGIMKRAEETGKEPDMPPMRALVQRAYQYAFSDQIEAQRSSARVNKARRQSSKRRPAGTRSKNKAPAYDPTSNDPSVIANDPAIVKFWDNAMAENGED